MKINSYFLFWLVLSCLSILLTVVAARVVIDDISLDDNSALVEAEVTNSRIDYGRIRGDSSKSYDLQYKFSLPDDSVEYTHAEAATGRKNLWADLPIEDWHEAKETKVVLVQYNIEDPWKNKIHGTSNKVDNIFGLIFSILMMLVIVWLTFAIGKNLRKKR